MRARPRRARSSLVGAKRLEHSLDGEALVFPRARGRYR